MKKYKNVDLAEMYKVSEKSIRNWIDLSKEKKLNLKLIEDQKRAYIADTPTNHLLLKNLAEKGKKFKNRKSLINITPNKLFYEIFNQNQIINLITDLQTYREIDLKYVYLADTTQIDNYQSWEDYFNKALHEDGNNTPKNTLELLESNLPYILKLTKGYKFINIIDIGVGNGFPARKIIEFFQSKKILKKYIGIDYSTEMLNSAKKNINKWFKQSVNAEYYQRDFNYDGIRDLLFLNTQSTEENPTMNIIFFLGSTIENQRSQLNPLQLFRNSMNYSDLLVITESLNNDESRRILSFSENEIENRKDSKNELFFLIPDQLGIPHDSYVIERIYSEKQNSRMIRIKLKTDINLRIDSPKIKKNIKFYSGDTIVVWRHRHHSLLDGLNDLDKAGFQVLHGSSTDDEGNMIAVAKVKDLSTE